VIWAISMKPPSLVSAAPHAALAYA
jgi:hypothetical protein